MDSLVFSAIRVIPLANAGKVLYNKTNCYNFVTFEKRGSDNAE